MINNLKNQHKEEIDNMIQENKNKINEIYEEMNSKIKEMKENNQKNEIKIKQFKSIKFNYKGLYFKRYKS